jgi:hypothetical protein
VSAVRFAGAHRKQQAGIAAKDLGDVARLHVLESKGPW